MHLIPILSLAFQAWMIVDCFQRGAEWYWYLIIMFFGPVGALIYFVAVRQSSAPANFSGNSFPGNYFANKKRLKDIQSKVYYNPNALNYLDLGNCYYDMRKYQEAIKNYEQTIQQEPDSIEALYKQALCYIKLGMNEHSIINLEKVINKDPSYQYGEAYLSLADTYYMLGEKQKALDAYQEVLKRNSFFKARYNYGLLLIEFGRNSEAIKQMKEIVIDGDSLPDFVYKRDKKYINLAKGFLAKNKI